MTKKNTAKNPKAKETVDKLTDTRKRRLTFDIPVSLHTKLKITAVKRGETMAEIICNVLEEYLSK